MFGDSRRDTLRDDNAPSLSPPPKPQPPSITSNPFIHQPPQHIHHSLLLHPNSHARASTRHPSSTNSIFVFPIAVRRFDSRRFLHDQGLVLVSSNISSLFPPFPRLCSPQPFCSPPPFSCLANPPNWQITRGFPRVRSSASRASGLPLLSACVHRAWVLTAPSCRHYEGQPLDNQLA